MRTTEVVVSDLLYPEGPRWHAGQLWFSDLIDRRVMSWDGQTKATRVVASFDDRPSGLGFAQNGMLLVVMMEQSRLMQVAPDGTSTLYADLSASSEGFNDMIVDDLGRAYLDSRDSKLERDGSGSDAVGSLLMLRPDGTHSTIAGDLMAPNGIAMTADRRTLYVAEPPARRITAFRVDEDGMLHDRRVLVEFDDGGPDGICVDAEGAVWAGTGMTHEARRITPDGEIVDRVRCADRMAIAPVLGGDDGRTLFLCTAEFPSVEVLIGAMFDPSVGRGSCHGWIEAATVDVPGAGWP